MRVVAKVDSLAVVAFTVMFAGTGVVADSVGDSVYKHCRNCHGLAGEGGKDGRGRADKEAPPLVNQYPRYLLKQIRDFVNGRRQHEHANKMFGELYEEEVESLLVYLGYLGKLDQKGG